MFDLSSVYLRLVAYAATFFAGLVPAWALGWLAVSPAGLLHIDIRGLSVAILIAVVASFSIFAKWGVKPDFFTGSDLFGSYLRVAMYSITGLVGMLPAGIAGTVYIDNLNYGLTVDLPSLGYALAAGLGLNLGIFHAFGIKPAKR